MAARRIRNSASASFATVGVAERIGGAFAAVAPAPAFGREAGSHLSRAVSYTHLDVYKRQGEGKSGGRWPPQV